jgi:hypothetical protein
VAGGSGQLSVSVLSGRRKWSVVSVSSQWPEEVVDVYPGLFSQDYLKQNARHSIGVPSH